MQDERMARNAASIKPFLVKPGQQVVLGKDFDPAYCAPALQKDQSETLLREGVELLREYQARLAAQNTYGLLVIIQALDAAGKDGTISHVMSGVNPQGVNVASFKTPSTEELEHDFMWRCAKVLPARGDITIFNRSYYEEVLVVRVHPEFLAGQHLPPSATKGDMWKRRFRDINNWERYLVDNGFKIVKLFLNVSKEEQRRRFLDRLEEPDKNWKFSVADAAEREHWDEYQLAFSDMLSHTSTAYAPWYVIPADHKWYARVAAAAAIVDALAKIDPQFPVITAQAKQGLEQAKAALEAEAPKPRRARAKPAAASTGGGCETEAEPTAAPEAAAEATEAGAPTNQRADRFLAVRIVKPGEIELNGKCYRYDVVIEGGKIRKRKKKASKAFKGEDGHTPLSIAEEIPWGPAGLIVGTGLDGGLPITAEVFEESNRRGLPVVALRLQEALGLLASVPREEAFAVLHVGC
jgi:PPK2 family polyphosphate:nucleotide phosphotransferase